MTRQRNHTRKGFNLIEAAIVLGVVGLVIGGIWTAASAVRQKQRVQQTVDGLHIIHDRLSKTFHGLPISSDQNITGQILQDMGAIPTGWSVNASNRLASPVFPDIEIQVYDDSSPDRGKIYYLGYHQDPTSDADCALVATKWVADAKNDDYMFFWGDSSYVDIESDEWWYTSAPSPLDYSDNERPAPNAVLEALGSDCLYFDFILVR